MVWKESSPQPFRVPEDVVDLSFKIQCPMVPVDHAETLSRAVIEQLPWLADEPRAGIHLIHGAETGNGWQRPDHNGDQFLHLSKRARFVLRLPSERITAAKTLCGSTLDLDGCALTIGASRARPLSAQTTVFSRHVVGTSPQTETQFIENTVTELEAMGIAVRKLLCGRLHALRTTTDILYVRSLLVADLSVEHSVLLQRNGLGSYQKLGCGIFIPHKSIQAVHEPGADK